MSIWWMYENHTFKRLSDNLSEAYWEAIDCWKEDPYGSLGVKDSHGDGLVVHGHGRDYRCEFVNDLNDWMEAVNNNHRQPADSADKKRLNLHVIT